MPEQLRKWTSLDHIAAKRAALLRNRQNWVYSSPNSSQLQSWEVLCVSNGAFPEARQGFLGRFFSTN